MVEAASMFPNLNDQQQYRLNKINEIKNYFIVENKERELMSERLSKYIAFFVGYLDKSLIVLSVASGNISIVLLATVIGTPVGIVSGSFSFAFSITTGIFKKLFKIKQKKRHDKIVILARSIINSIES